VRNGAAYEAVAAELGVSVESMTVDESPTGALTTMRDEHGSVLLYIVHTNGCDVGFAPDGTARFYDLELSVGGFIPAGSDVRVSPAWEAQRGTVPDHLLLTNRGTIGLYAAESANGAIYAAWADRNDKVYTAVIDASR
jgi:hypothetical protein